MDKNKKTFQVPTLLAFAAIVAIMVIVGVRVLNVPVVPMCLLVIIEAVIAVMLHHAELWVHGLLILAELCAGVAGKKTVLIILCAVVYIAATFALQMLDKGETHNDSSDSSYYSRQQLDELFLQMIAFFSGDPKRIQHFMKVHSFARIIGTKEGLDETSLFILEAAAYTHDIGIRPAEEKYGRCDGKLQEQEGPIVAQRMLSDVGIENYLIDRICYLIGHHHTYDNIEGLDYQILVEADFLVNLYEDDVNRHGIEQAYQQIFRTQTGKEIFNQMYTDER